MCLLETNCVALEQLSLPATIPRILLTANGFRDGWRVLESCCVATFVNVSRNTEHHCLPTFLVTSLGRTLVAMAKRTAGQRLRAKMNAALRATGIAGAEFDEYELEALDAACAVADRAEQLQAMYDAELAKGDEAKATTLVRLSAEARHCERQSLQLLDRVRVTPEPPKSARHQRAANARWGRRDRLNQPVVDGHVVRLEGSR